MKTLVIHPKDNTTEFLFDIYKHLDCTVIRSWVSNDFLMLEMKRADRIIMLGHGLPQGLLGVGNSIIVNDKHVDILRKKTNNIYIWCNADVFVAKNKLSGLATGMIISEKMEANLFGLGATKNLNSLICESNKRFALAIRAGIYKDTNDAVRFSKLRYLYKYGVQYQENPIVDFNVRNIHSYLNGVVIGSTTNITELVTT